MCQKLKVSQASFYRRSRPNVPMPTQDRHDELGAHVVRVYTRGESWADRDHAGRREFHEALMRVSARLAAA